MFESDSISVRSKIKTISESIERHLTETQKLINNSSMYSAEYVNTKLKDMKNSFVSTLNSSLNAFTFSVSTYRNEIESAKETMSKAWTPDTKTDELLHYERRTDYLNSFLRRSPQKLIDEYERLSNTNINPERVAMIEESAVLFLHSTGHGTEASKLQSLINMNIRKRTALLNEHYGELLRYESLERTAKRIMSSADSGIFNDSDIYIFYSLSSKMNLITKNLDAVRFRQISRIF